MTHSKTVNITFVILHSVLSGLEVWTVQAIIIGCMVYHVYNVCIHVGVYGSRDDSDECRYFVIVTVLAINDTQQVIQ